MSVIHMQNLAKNREHAVMKTRPATEAVRDECAQFALSDLQLAALMTLMDSEIRNGLGARTNGAAAVKCYATYVQDMPDGTERGRYLALDLGGTNFRVLCVGLGATANSNGTGSSHAIDSEIYTVPEAVRTGTGVQLFDHIAACLAQFVADRRIVPADGAAIPLGFTFSFPLRQAGLARGYLCSWTKGFDCSGVVGRDVVALLRDALVRRGDVAIDVCGVLNDTTGTIMSCAWDHPNTRIGLIVGTGCNACYVERVENVELFDGDRDKTHVIVNTEWGAFGDLGGPLDVVRTEHDRRIDDESLNPRKQVFEKLISGMYMGEIVRLVLVKLTGDNALFGGRLSAEMATAGAFGASYVSDIERDLDNYNNTVEVLKKMGVADPSAQDCANVRYVCESVSTRSAHLVSVGLAVLLNKMDEKSVTIGVDGSVFRFHPRFRSLMVEKTRRLTKPDISFKVVLSKDGSGRGAAFVAAVAVKNKELAANGGANGATEDKGGAGDDDAGEKGANGVAGEMGAMALNDERPPERNGTNKRSVRFMNL